MTANAPHIRHTERAVLMRLDVLLMLFLLLVVSFVFYGWRPVLLTLVAMLTAVFCETVCCLLMRRRPTVLDGTAAVTGALIGSLLSPIAPYWLPVVGAVFAIVIVKMPFGGTGRNLFNPAAAGIAFCTLCFSEEMFTYPDPRIGQWVPLSTTFSMATAASPNAQLTLVGHTSFDWRSFLLGDLPGPVGATAVAVLLTCSLYLFFRRSASAVTTLSFLATCFLLALLFPRAAGGRLDAALVELGSGMLLFAGVFLLTDPVTSPHTSLGRLFFGMVAGCLTILLRHIGRFEEGVCFAVLLANAAAPLLDRGGYRLSRAWWNRRKGGAGR